MYGPKRNHVLYIFDGFLKNFGAAIVALILLLSGKTNDTLQEILIIIAASPIIHLIDYFTTTFEINETYLIMRKGFITKKKTEIPLETITTVDLTQDLLFQLFGVCKIKIDNTTQVKDAANEAEAVLVLKKEEAFTVKQLLLSRSKGQREAEELLPKETVSVKSEDFMLLGLMQSKLGYILSILSLSYIIAGIFSSDEGLEFEYLLNTLHAFSSKVNSFGMYALIFLILYFVVLAYSLLSNVINYYNFRLCKNGSHLNIEYGLLHKKKYSLSMEKINGVRLKQNPLMRIFKYYTIEVFVIGYGDKAEEGEQKTAILLPIAKRGQVKTLFAKLLPDFELPETMSKPQKRALPYFFLSFGFIASMLLFIGLLFTQNILYISIAALLTVIAAIGVLIEFKVSGISVNNKNVVIAKGKYSYTTTIIKTGSIESASCTASVLKRRKGICHIRFGFFGPKNVSNTIIRNMNIPDFEALRSVLEV